MTSLINKGAQPLLSENEQEAIEKHYRGRMSYLLNESIFIWQDKIIYITKVISPNFSYVNFISNIMDCIKRSSFVCIDFHGLVEKDRLPIFIFASRNTSIIKNSGRNGFIIESRTDKKELQDFFEDQTELELMTAWFDIHSDICQYGDSGMRPTRLLAMTIIIQDRHHGKSYKSYES